MKKSVIEARTLAMRAAFDRAKEAKDSDGFADAVKQQFEALLAELGDSEDIDIEDRFTALQTTIEGLKTSGSEVADLKAKYEATLQSITTLKEGMESAKAKSKVPTLRAVLESNADKLKELSKNEKPMGFFKVEAAAMTMGNSIVGDNKMFLPVPDVDAEIAKPATPVRTVLQDVNLSGMNSPRIVYVDKSPMNGVAMFIAEGAVKPQVDWTYTPSIAEAVKIAVTTKISNEMLEDLDFIEGEIRNDLYDELILEISKELVVHQAANTAAAGKLANLMGIATPYVNPGLTGQVQSPNFGDALYAAASQIRALGYSNPLTAYVSPAIADLMVLNKDTTNNYIGFGRTLDNIRVVGNPELTGTQFVIGDFSKFHVKMYKNITVEAGYGNVTIGGVVISDWEANFVTFRAEARLASYVKTNDKNAFVVGDLAVVQADIAKA